MIENFDKSTDITHSCLNTEQVNNVNKQQNHIEHLNLNKFKVIPCNIKYSHSHKNCHMFHNDKDRKRQGNFYFGDLCQYIARNQICPMGDNCMKYHNVVEQLYNPDKYKTKFCSYYPDQIQNCEYGIYCSFAHSQINNLLIFIREEDILIELIHNYEYDHDFYIFHYKTVMCPFNLTQHNKSLCVYAHNWQDFRRNPDKYEYIDQPCQYWNIKDFILNYQDGCPLGIKCQKCHGWKEMEYHPKQFKTKPCSNAQNCYKGKDCPNYHSQMEQIIINTDINYNYFLFKPKNRITHNTFKRVQGQSQNSNSFNNQFSSKIQLSQQHNSTQENSNQSLYNNNESINNRSNTSNEQNQNKLKTFSQQILKNPEILSLTKKRWSNNVDINHNNLNKKRWSNDADINHNKNSIWQEQQQIQYQNFQNNFQTQKQLKQKRKQSNQSLTLTDSVDSLSNHNDDCSDSYISMIEQGINSLLANDFE